ncbi:MAG: hypothetical protein ACOYM0_15635 [Bacteroidales bacterium]
MNGLKEINFEDTVFDYLKGSTLYSVRNSDDVDLEYVLDKYLLEQFIRDSQPDIWRKLEKLFPSDPMEAVADEFAKLRNKRGVLNLIRDGFTLQGAKINLIWFKPASGLNPEHLKKYQANRFSVIRQFHYSTQYPD